MTETPRPKKRRAHRRGVGFVKTIDLESGGTLTLTGRFDVFQLAPADRAFVFALRDYLDQHPRPVEQVDVRIVRDRVDGVEVQ